MTVWGDYSNGPFILLAQDVVYGIMLTEINVPPNPFLTETIYLNYLVDGTFQEKTSVLHCSRVGGQTL